MERESHGEGVGGIEEGRVTDCRQMLARICIDFASTIAGSVGIFRGTRRTTSGGNLNSSQLALGAHLLIHNSLGQMLPHPSPSAWPATERRHFSN